MKPSQSGCKRHGINGLYVDLTRKHSSPDTMYLSSSI